MKTARELLKSKTLTEPQPPNTKYETVKCQPMIDLNNDACLRLIVA